MRLGMGYNSFTQQVCINGTVRPAGGRREGASDPPPRYKIETTAPDSGSADNGQEIVWTAKFIDKISEVAESLNVTGLSQLKCESGGMLRTSASFVDIKNFQQSDVNYLIQVRVTNQRPTAPNLTEFDPMPNLSPLPEFTRIYGDTFISDFIEGGELNVLISIKLDDRSKSNHIKRQLESYFNSTSRDLAPIDGDISIAVSWKGGAGIMDGTNTNWTLESLKSTAMEFPAKAMAHPARIYALLTKYTSLKSFYQNSSVGAPLDYTNASGYAYTLLDAYMDYKLILRSIQQAAREVERGESALIAKEAVPALAEISIKAKANYKKQLKQFQQDSGQSAEVRSDHRFKFAAPATSNVTQRPRPADTVAEKPQVACNPMRARQYLNPLFFRMLLPSVMNLEKERAAQLAAEAAKIAADAQEQLCLELTRRLEESGERCTAAENAKTELEDKLRVAKELNPYGGWCPVAAHTPVRLRAYVSGKCMDYNYCGGNGNHSLHQYDVADHRNQRFEICPVGPKGFSIRHIESGRYLAVSTDVGDARVYMAISRFPSIFTFEEHVDGSVLVHLAEQNGYTLNVEAAAQHNGAKLIGWAVSTGSYSRAANRNEPPIPAQFLSYHPSSKFLYPTS
ncbi:hypothetical protein DFH09DRAFT_1278000 [Mycena vulgaris]|nr:hypothetical protein DFH09DRAFT_1278000 [Mycena vulgaris]